MKIKLNVFLVVCTVIFLSLGGCEDVFNGGMNEDGNLVERAGTAQCVQENEGGTATLSCPSGQIINSIAFASYGTPTGSCPNFSNGSCHASSSKSKVETACLNKESCTVGANNGVFGDPCVGNYKKLAVAYSCVSTNAGQCAEVNEGSTAALSCPSGQVIKSIGFASYGTPTGSCPNFGASSCHASTSKSKVETACLNKQSCTVGANNAVFGDPCVGTYKKLAVAYSCVSTNAGQCAEGNEGSNATLSCPSGQIINSIAFASYGTPTGSCPNFSNGSCHASTSKSKVESACLNKQSCTVGANNDVFGDPCVGVGKKLAVAYSCSAGGVPACSAPTPISGPDSKCTSTRWVEPISTLPDKWKSLLDTSVWTKWVRSIIPVVGQTLTHDAALLETAYYAEKVHMPNGQIIVPDLINSMLGAHPTRFSVYPACPNAYMHPGIRPPTSSGGGAGEETLVGEDYILRYPKCTGAYAVACDKIPLGTLCNNCAWDKPSIPVGCRDTLAHEHGHTCDLHRRSRIDSSVDAIAKEVFPGYDIEGPAWAAEDYFMNPSAAGVGRDRGQHIMPPRELDYWSVTQKFTMSEYPAGWGYVLKTTRCPQMGLTEACPDTLTRTYAVPLDSYRASSGN